MDNIRIHLIIEGRVQGVWFRGSTQQEADKNNIKGWVRNRPEGTVEVVAEGPENLVKDFVSWCGQGPPSARVDKIQQKQEPWKGEFSSFEVTY